MAARDMEHVLEPTPLGALVRGLLAGLAGTAAMTAFQEVKSRVQSSNGGGESPGGGEQQSWEDAPEPAKVGKRISEGVFHEEVPEEQIDTVSNLVHWAYGTGWGGLYGLAHSTFHGRTLTGGTVFGGTVWGSGYVVLPAMKLYKPIWKYPASTLAQDLAAHLVYGLGVAGAYRLLERRS